MTRKERARKIIVYGIYTLFFVSFQVTFPDTFSFMGQVADFMLVFVVISGYLFGSFDGAVLGLITGFARDYFSGISFGGTEAMPSAAMGVGMLVFLYIGVGSSLLFTQSFHRRLPLGLVQVLIFTFAYKVLGHIAAIISGLIMGRGFSYLPFTYILFQSILPQLLLNVIISIPIIFLLRFVGPYRGGINKILILESDRKEDKWQIA